MYLFEIKDLPKKAGKAKIEWDWSISTPKRDRKEIYLPENPTATFFHLKDETQFLFDSNGKTWFGGTDEEPFLVELDREALNKFIIGKGNEEIFYQSLVPQKIKDISVELNSPYKRQGDVFAARLCEEKYLEKTLSRLLSEPEFKVEHGMSNVLRTRHIGKGTFVRINRRELFRGIIEAPDHKTLNLEDALYVLDQTRYLVNPSNAD